MNHHGDDGFPLLVSIIVSSTWHVRVPYDTRYDIDHNNNNMGKHVSETPLRDISGVPNVKVHLRLYMF